MIETQTDLTKGRRARPGETDPSTGSPPKSWSYDTGQGGTNAENPTADRAMRRARGLGWFSLALGATQLLAPKRLSYVIGLACPKRRLMQAVGMRELAAGVGLLGSRKPTGWVWARVAGDVMDLGLLGAALGARKSDKRRLTAALATVVGATTLDLLTARGLSRGVQTSRRTAGGEPRVQKSITINCPPEKAYTFWRNFEQLPTIMSHLQSVSVQDDRRSHWKVKGPANHTFEWDAEITDDQPNTLIAWRSIGSSEVSTTGIVRFLPAPGGRGTEVHIDMRYAPPGGVAGKVGAQIAKAFGKEPGQQVEGDLRRFKQVMETGEVVHSDASIHPGPHPARPSAQGGV